MWTVVVSQMLSMDNDNECVDGGDVEEAEDYCQ